MTCGRGGERHGQIVPQAVCGRAPGVEGRPAHGFLASPRALKMGTSRGTDPTHQAGVPVKRQFEPQKPGKRPDLMIFQH